MLERVGLGEKFDAFPDRLSGGQQQRVAIARALAMSPKVLLCDEITSALDPELVNEVLSVVRQLAKDGMTLIMVTHEMRFAREVGDKLVFMHQGKVHEVGDPKVLFANPRTPSSPTSSAQRNSRTDQLEAAQPSRIVSLRTCKASEGRSVSISTWAVSRFPGEPATRTCPGSNWPLAVSPGRWAILNRWHAHPPGRA
jgi:ABC-type methionine transport system ATPase subunit